LFSLPVIKYKNIFLAKKQELKKPINEEIFLTELSDRFNEVHNESGRSILEGEELSTRETVPLMEFINKFLNSLSAMLPLPSVTLPLPLFKILPLPFLLISRASLGPSC